MNKSDLKQLIREELSNMGESNDIKIDFSFNQVEIELLVDALEEYKENYSGEWWSTPTARRLLSNLKSKSDFHS